LYFVRALSYCDINKIELSVLKDTLNTYPEFADEFMSKIRVTFNLKRVSETIEHISRSVYIPSDGISLFFI